MIVSKDVIDNIKTEGNKFISLGNVNVKGFANPVEVFKLTSLEFSCKARLNEDGARSAPT